MKRYILISIALLLGTTVIASKNNDAVIKKLEAKGEYRLAAEMLVENLNENFSVQECRNSLEFSQRVLAQLSTEIKYQNISLFIPPEKDGYWKRNIDNIGIGLLVNLVWPMGIGNSAYQVWLNKKATDKQRNAVRKLHIFLLSIEQSQQILNTYDSIKLIIMSLEKNCKTEIKKNSEKFDSLLKILKEIRTLKKRLKNDRTTFLSYNVISPYLWEAERQIFLADSDYLALQIKNKETLDNAVMVLSKACHKEWLYQASEDVRMQFIGTQKALKQVASKTELEDYKVVTTLSDSIDSSKKRGADAWFK